MKPGRAIKTFKDIDDGLLRLNLTRAEATWLYNHVSAVQTKTKRTAYIKEQILYGLAVLFQRK